MPYAWAIRACERSRLTFLRWWAIITVQLKRVNFFLTQYLLHFNSPTPPSNLTPSNRPSGSFKQRRTFLVWSFNACSNVYFSWFNISCKNHRATVARPSRDSRTTVTRRSWDRREAVDGNKCSQFHLANIVRVSRECRTNVARMSWNIRQWFVRHSCDCRKYVLITRSVWPQCDYGCNVVFLSPKRVSN